MTAGGQIIVRARNEALPPVTFRVNIPVMAVRVSGSDPYRMSTWRLFPPARLPVICVSFIVVVSAYPDMVPAWTGGTMLADADRGPKPYYDLSMTRYPERKAKQRGKNQFSHLVLLRLQRAGGWPFIVKFRGTATSDVGLFVESRIKPSERTAILLRLEGFNLFNHGNYLGRGRRRRVTRPHRTRRLVVGRRRHDHERDPGVRECRPSADVSETISDEEFAHYAGGLRAILPAADLRGMPAEEV